MSSSGIFTGTAGVYHVMSELSLQRYHAAATHGNAPSFDILVCNCDGSQSVAIQVESTRWATRERGRGESRTPTKLDFPLGCKAGKINSEKVLFAFVDFGVSPNQKPNVYLIPSTRLYSFCEPWIDNFEGKMVRFQPDIKWVEEFKNNWKPLTVAGIVASEPDVDGDENKPAQPAEADPSTGSG